MAVVEEKPTYNWLCKGDDIFPAMLKAIEEAHSTIRLETYTFAGDDLGNRFRDALVGASRRGVSVQVLIDGLGSVSLPATFWDPLREAGGVARVFNPISLNRVSFRDHRKVLVVDEAVAFVGGFNIASEYVGDGVTCGWCDVGLKIEGPLARELASSFDVMFARAEFRHKRFARLRKSSVRKEVAMEGEQILFGGPGRGTSPIKRALSRDLSRARDVKIIVAYFLPSWSLRHELTRVVERGGRVQLILAGKSDVLVSQLAGRSLYRRLLKAGVEIFEYQPQILHAKLIIADNAVYVGSCNLDPRSLQINYELMVRIQSERMGQQAREVFDANLKHSAQVTRQAWRESRTVWRRLKQRWAYFLLVRVDPWIARRQWHALPD